MSSFEESRDSADHVASLAGQGTGIYMSLFGCEFNFGARAVNLSACVSARELRVQTSNYWYINECRMSMI
jgi:hypothetical protein